ncbi:hypothetical protein ARALYDRAFT_892097 [Arabidopsis lyrata subsp. lyrata]|uniref:F-box associated beta-propeller type 3 domain-containing protein n=1 Tax=Arabidopsis lyrata subsp. lyrata TaxID=81972 RepID=D7KHQ5_ARALL|nr:hypothetical protein ARALYDRAFT_892097 [Arabidopsis lyrata subsp. lyrata]
MPKVKSSDYIMQSNSIRGFICCFLNQRRFVVCNPTTRQVMVLPEDDNPTDYKLHKMYLGYTRTPEAIVCTLGGQQSSYSWRRVESDIHYYNYNNSGVYIDGIVYYDVCLNPWINKCKAVSSFDVGSEQLRLIKTPEKLAGVLTNYLGKLAAYYNIDDVKNQVWSHKTFVLPSFTRSFFLDLSLHFAGIIAAGEIVYVPLWFSDPFEIFCYDVEKMMERRVRVEGLVDNIFDDVGNCAFKNICYASGSCCYVSSILYL